MNKLLFALLILSLSACSALVDMANMIDPSSKSFTVPYKEPEVNTSTRLRVISDTTVKIIPNRSCIDWNAPGTGMVSSHTISIGHDKTHNDQIIGIPRAGEIKNSSEVYIKANEPLVLVYGHHSTCLITASFIPENNADYQVLTNTSNGRCSMVLSRVATNSSTNEITYLPLKLEESKPCK